MRVSSMGNIRKASDDSIRSKAGPKIKQKNARDQAQGQANAHARVKSQMQGPVLPSIAHTQNLTTLVNEVVKGMREPSIESNTTTVKRTELPRMSASGGF